MTFLNKKVMRRLKRAGLVIITKKEYDLYMPKGELQQRIAELIDRALPRIITKENNDVDNT